MAGVLPPIVKTFLAGAAKAPKPEERSFSNDWLQNLDTMAHGLGCVMCGMFDEIVSGLTAEEIAEQNPAELFAGVQAPGIRRWLTASFETCQEIHKEYGTLAAAVQSGKFKPEGLATKAFMVSFKQGKEDDSKRMTPMKSLLNLRTAGLTIEV
jgi:hypothetical protein